MGFASAKPECGSVRREGGEEARGVFQSIPSLLGNKEQDRQEQPMSQREGAIAGDKCNSPNAACWWQ